MNTLSKSIIVRIRFAAVALIGLGLGASFAIAAPNGTVVDAPSCAGGSVAVCKKHVVDGLKIVGCAEYRCEMPKTKLRQSIAPRYNRPTSMAR